jgi:hypothetical protein
VVFAGSRLKLIEAVYTVDDRIGSFPSNRIDNIMGEIDSRETSRNALKLDIVSEVHLLPSAGEWISASSGKFQSYSEEQQCVVFNTAIIQGKKSKNEKGKKKAKAESKQLLKIQKIRLLLSII